MTFLSRALCLLVFCCCFASVSSAEQITVNKIVAVVNGEMITLHELRSRTAADMARSREGLAGRSEESVLRASLDAMVNDILLRQEGERLKITIADTDIESEMRRLIQRSKMSPKDFESRLVSQGSSMTDLRAQIRHTILRQRMYSFMVARKISVPEEQVRGYYDQNKSEFITEKLADFSIITFNNSVKPEKIYEQLKNGSLSFEDAAKQYSTDMHAKKGGSVGNIPFAKLPPAMQKLFSSMKPGQLSPLIRMDKAFGVFRLNKLTAGGETLPFEQVKPRIEEIVREPLVRERMNDYVKQLRSKAVIDIRL